jgi:SAM-dependent methyltransferase
MAQHVPLNSIVDRSLNYGRHLVSRFLEQANRNTMNVVLDIGAGRGGDLELARLQNASVELHAIEIYPEYQQGLVQKGIKVHPLNIEQDKFPFLDESVDVVIANQILEHTKEIFWILHEVSRVLRVGGTFIIGVPNLASLHNRVLLAIGKQPTSIQNYSAHVRGYTKQDILKLFTIAFPDGYTLKDFGGSNFYPFPPLIAKPLAAFFPTMAWGIFLRMQKQRSYDKEFLTHPVSYRLETNFYLGEK